VKLHHTLFIICLIFSNLLTQEADVVLQLDLAWEKLKKSISTGDFTSFKSLYHEDAILVNGILKNSYPINKAFNGWKQGFDDTKSGKINAYLEIIFTERLFDEQSAHESGIFHYYTIDNNGHQTDSYVHFESLWVKKNYKWLMTMEFQKSKTNKVEWDEFQKNSFIKRKEER
tara:strand:+ start:9709 stop:10224 length:516 start_codon:yes stop_codon:yes gene_type:complete